MNYVEQQDIEEIIACLKLIRWRGLGLRYKYRVVWKLQSCTAALDLNIDEWQQIAKQKVVSKQLPQYCDIQKDLAWLKNAENRFITCLLYTSPSPRDRG